MIPVNRRSVKVPPPAKCPAGAAACSTDPVAEFVILGQTVTATPRKPQKRSQTH